MTDVTPTDAPRSVPFDLSGQIALVTGAGRGIGLAIATSLARHGAVVAINDLDEQRAEAGVEHVRQHGGSAVAAVGDVVSGLQMENVVAQIEASAGPVSILVNNAGVPVEGLEVVPFAQSTSYQWQRHVDLNLFGPMNCVQAVLPRMAAQRFGRIVTIVSDAGRIGEPGLAAYSAAKAGAIGFTRSLAREVGASDITCNCVALGWIEGSASDGGEERATRALRHYAVKRLGRPADVAAAVLWLASSDAGWVTGQTIGVDGGYVML